jgi:hypothetical protein
VDSARTAWRHAADILDLLRHPDADKIRAKLTNTQRSGGGHDATDRTDEGEQPDPEARIG